MAGRAAKLPVLSGDELNKVLADLCFRHVRTKGSHKVLERGKHILVVPLHRELKRGTLKEIVKAYARILNISYEEARKLLVDRRLRRRCRSFLCPR
ncbi:MAG: hypothetical protein DRN15_06430 [Thermoprotei archaeon]|nr:MAG: hypothetical protein DRN15_06430 [Thermoprotei archaeon]